MGDLINLLRNLAAIEEKKVDILASSFAHVFLFGHQFLVSGIRRFFTTAAMTDSPLVPALSAQRAPPLARLRPIVAGGLW